MQLLLILSLKSLYIFQGQFALILSLRTWVFLQPTASFFLCTLIKTCLFLGQIAPLLLLPTQLKIVLFLT